MVRVGVVIGIIIGVSESIKALAQYKALGYVTLHTCTPYIT